MADQPSAHVPMSLADNHAARRQSQGSVWVAYSAGRDDGGSAPGGLTRHLAARIARTLAVLAQPEASRILVVEPHSSILPEALRANDPSCDLWALRRESTRAVPAFDHEVTGDWLADDESLTEQLGTFDVVVVSGLVRLVSRAGLPRIVGWLARLVRERGYLLLCEPSPPLSADILEDLIRENDCIVAADQETIDDGWTYRLIAGQRHASDMVSHIAGIQSITWDDLERQPKLRAALVTAYRTVFGGSEWREWMRCTAAECGRQYSQEEYTAECLPLGDRCLCGRSGTLVPVHAPAKVIEMLRTELLEPAESCCYVRLNDSSQVEAFCWGYVDSTQSLARLLGASDNSARHAIEHSLEAYVDSCAFDTPDARIYRLAEGGIMEEARNGHLTYALLQRLLQWSYDHNVQVVIGRTSPRTPMYAIFRGLGMEVVYRYDQGAGNANIAPEASADTGAASYRQSDDRVILAGSVLPMLQAVATESTRRLSWRIAQQMRVERGAG